MNRNEAIELLRMYDRFLMDKGYVDSDIWAETPTTIDEFLEQDWAKEKIPIDKVSSIMEKKHSTNIEDVDISIRCYQSLKAVGIVDIRQISNYTKQDLLATGFFGKRTTTEIDELISPLGIKWKASPAKVKTNNKENEGAMGKTL
jgi:DNA-directed RNA polymerase alpha subunit